MSSRTAQLPGSCCRASAEVYIDETPVPKEQLKMGHASSLEGVNLVIWLELESTSMVTLSVQPAD